MCAGSNIQHAQSVQGVWESELRSEISRTLFWCIVLPHRQNCGKRAAPTSCLRSIWSARQDQEVPAGSAERTQRARAEVPGSPSVRSSAKSVHAEPWHREGSHQEAGAHCYCSDGPGILGTLPVETLALTKPLVKTLHSAKRV